MLSYDIDFLSYDFEIHNPYIKGAGLCTLHNGLSYEPIMNFTNHWWAYKTKIKYVYFIIIAKNNEVYLTTYEQKPYEENLHEYNDEKIAELYENEKDIFDEEIEEKKIKKFSDNIK